MWTRLIAGAAAHDINNLTQSLFNLLALRGAADATPESSARYGALARDGLKELRRLGAALRALAHCEREAYPHRIDLVCADVVTETDAADGRSVAVGAAPAGAWVRGTAEALRLAIQAPLRYGLAASPPGAEVRVGVAVAPDAVIVTINAPQAPTSIASTEPVPLEALLASPGQELPASCDLVLSGAIARQYGGELRVGRGALGGLAFKIQFGRAEEESVDARREEGAAPGDARR